MLRVIQHYQTKILQDLKNGTYGTNENDFEVIAVGGPSLGIPSKQLRSIFLVLSKMDANGEVLINDEFDAEAFDLLLMLVGFDRQQRKAYKYVGDKDNYKTRLTTSRWMVGKEMVIEVGVCNELYDDGDVLQSKSTPQFAQTRVDNKRRRFDLAIDNPLHVVNAINEAHENGERVVLTINPVVCGHQLKVKTFVIALVELLNVTMYSKTAGLRERYLLNPTSALPDMHARYFTIDALVNAITSDMKNTSRFIFDFTDAKEAKVFHKRTGVNMYLYSVMAKPDPFRYQIPSNVMATIIASHVSSPRPGTEPGHGFTLVKSLFDINQLAKYFYIKDNDTSTKKVTGSLHDYYVNNGGSDLLLTWSLSVGVVDDHTTWTLALYDLSNGLQVIRCDAKCVTGKPDSDARVIHPITTDDDLGYNLIDVEIFIRRVGVLLKNGRTVIVRRKDKTAFTLHPYALEALPYAGDKGEVTDERIKAQTSACFTNVIEVELKQKPVNEKRGYQFLTEPQR